MSTAEDFDALSPEQYGSIKAKVANISSFNTHLIYDLKRLKRIPSTSTFANLVSNYYIVVHSIASLSMQRANIPK